MHGKEAEEEESVGKPLEVRGHHQRDQEFGHCNVLLCVTPCRHSPLLVFALGNLGHSGEV